MSVSNVVEDKTVAVIMVAHGEAETSGFLDNFSMTRRTLIHASEVMQIPKPLQLFISMASGLKNRSRFRKLNYVSPQNGLTRKQAFAVGRSLMRHPEKGCLSFKVFPAFSVTPPFLENVIGNTRHYDARIMLYMAPVENSLNCGSICGYLKKNYTRHELAATKVISRFWKDGQLLNVYRDHIFQHAGLNADKGTGRSALVLVFHGTLVADAMGNPPSFHNGLKETMVFAGALQKTIINDARNSFEQIRVSFLNHDVGGKWSMPSLEQTLDRLRKENIENVALFSAGYFSEGNETLLKAREALLDSGIGVASYIPCINDSDAFVGYLSDRIITAAKQVINMNLHQS